LTFRSTSEQTERLSSGGIDRTHTHELDELARRSPVLPTRRASHLFPANPGLSIVDDVVLSVVVLCVAIEIGSSMLVELLLW
jgi:hypothetical protein